VKTIIPTVMFFYRQMLQIKLNQEQKHIGVEFRGGTKPRVSVVLSLWACYSPSIDV